jgi:hypothetical protein
VALPRFARTIKSQGPLVFGGSVFVFGFVNFIPLKEIVVHIHNLDFAVGSNVGSMRFLAC